MFVISCRIALVTFLVTLCGACSKSSAAPTPITGPVDVHGRVTDFVSGLGIEGIQVEIGSQHLVTDANGAYVVTIPVGNYELRVEGEQLSAFVMVRGPWTRGDFLARAPTGCTSRYGAVTDRETGRPIAGATVRGTRTGADGWYRADEGCSGCGVCGTTNLVASAPGYEEYSVLGGRGLRDVVRWDVELKPIHR